MLATLLCTIRIFAGMVWDERRGCFVPEVNNSGKLL